MQFPPAAPFPGGAVYTVCHVSAPEPSFLPPTHLEDDVGLAHVGIDQRELGLVGRVGKDGVHHLHTSVGERKQVWG